MAAFVIPVTSELFLYYLFTGVCVFCIFLFCGLKEPLPHPVDEVEVEETNELLNVPDADRKPLN
jgi:hypothetical protein